MLKAIQFLSEGLTVNSFLRGLELFHGKRCDGMFASWVFPNHLLNNGIAGVIAETI